MKIRVLVAGLLVALSATSAIAAGPYVGASTGASFFHDSDLDVPGTPVSGTGSYDPGYAFNLAGGYRFDTGLRLEGEFGYKHAEMDEIEVFDRREKLSDTDVSVMSFMLNGYYDFLPNATVTPVIGAGIGALRGEIDDEDGDFRDTVFGYQLTAGASIRLNKNFNLDFTYRFQGAASDFSLNRVDVSYHSSNLLAGVRYTFQ